MFLLAQDMMAKFFHSSPLTEIAALLVVSADVTTRLLWEVGGYSNQKPTFDLSDLNILLQEGADVHVTDTFEGPSFSRRRRPLHYVLDHGVSTAVVSLLLDSGADVHAQDTEHRIALDMEYASKKSKFGTICI